jgi:pimeloyl-ACP methyl ester carboxylesterase
VRWIALLAVTAVVTAACDSAPSWGAVEQAAGERQRVACRGTATPAIVLVHGIGDKANSASFEKLLDKIPQDRRVCRYDRPGTGGSPAPAHRLRDADDLDAELDAVVHEADPSGPVLLIGHSFGSYPVLTYTARHRPRVAAVVLADGVDPQFGLLAALGATSWSDVGMAGEQLDLAAVQQQTAAALQGATPAFADLPLMVIRRDRSVSPEWEHAQQRLAALSRLGVVVVAAGSGHQVPSDNPGAVLDAINRL